mgnify:CR=1 FL=1
MAVHRVVFRSSKRPDLVASAGWLYADLLLVLVIVGLGVASTVEDTSDLKKQIIALEISNSDLKKQIIALEISNSDLKKQIIALEISNSDLTNEMSDLKEENSKLQDELAQAQQKIVELQNLGSESWQLNCREVGLEVDKTVSQSELDAKVSKNIDLAISNRELNPLFTKVGMVLSYGGYDSESGETTDTGFRSAEKLLPLLQSSPLLQGAEFISNGARSVRINDTKQYVHIEAVYLKIYLVYKGDPALSHCGVTGS